MERQKRKSFQSRDSPAKHTGWRDRRDELGDCLKDVERNSQVVTLNPFLMRPRPRPIAVAAAFLCLFILFLRLHSLWDTKCINILVLCQDNAMKLL